MATSTSSRKQQTKKPSRTSGAQVKLNFTEPIVPCPICGCLVQPDFDRDKLIGIHGTTVGEVCKHLIVAIFVSSKVDNRGCTSNRKIEFSEWGLFDDDDGSFAAEFLLDRCERAHGNNDDVLFSTGSAAGREILNNCGVATTRVSWRAVFERDSETLLDKVEEY